MFCLKRFFKYSFIVLYLCCIVFLTYTPAVSAPPGGFKVSRGNDPGKERNRGNSSRGLKSCSGSKHLCRLRTSNSESSDDGGVPGVKKGWFPSGDSHQNRVVTQQPKPGQSGGGGPGGSPGGSGDSCCGCCCYHPPGEERQPLLATPPMALLEEGASGRDECCSGTCGFLPKGCRKHCPKFVRRHCPECACCCRNPQLDLMEGSWRDDSGGWGESGASLMSSYNRGAQLSSLVGLQGVLLGASDQALSNLKTLILKAELLEDPAELFNGSDDLRIGLDSGLSKGSRFPRRVAKPAKISAVSYSLFGFMDTYEANLERKASSGRVGARVSLASGVKAAFAYTCVKREVKKHEGFSLSQSYGSASARSMSEGASAAFVFNPLKSGFTGSFAGSYSWGKVKTARRGHGVVLAKGRPDSELTAAIVQFGYNLKFWKIHTLTPYMEALISKASWSGHEEVSRILPCRISKNRESVAERSAGARYQRRLPGGGQLQAWAAYAVGSRELAGLSSRPLVSRYSLHRIYAPGYKERYSGTELGLNYQFVCVENMTLGFTGTTRFGSLKKLEKQVYSAYIQYLY